MRKIRSFAAFETRHWPAAPGYFIPLHSIGHYLDPEEGVVYAMLKAGGYEDEPYDAEEYLFDEESEARERLTEKELEMVDSSYRDGKEILEPAIDKEFIEEVKDIALSEEILDRGYYLRIRAKLRLLRGFSGPVVYCEWYGHDKEDVWYPKLFKKAFRDIQEADRLSDSIVYEICVLRSNGPGGFMPVSKTQPDNVAMVQSLMSRIHDMDPRMFSRLEYSWW